MNLHPESLCVALSASSLEAPYVERSIAACTAAPVVQKIAVAYGTLLCGGEPEDADYFVRLRSRFASDGDKITFVEYAPQSPDEEEDGSASSRDSAKRHHNRAREAALRALDEWWRQARPLPGRHFWVMFVDGDEVPTHDGNTLTTWWQDMTAARPIAHLRPDCACKLAAYWYFLTPELRVREFEDPVIVIRRDRIPADGLNDEEERDGIVHRAVAAGTIDACHRYCVMMEQQQSLPLFHHYSWVRRDRHALSRKAAVWGHRDDKPWRDLLKAAWEEYDASGGELPEVEFVHGRRIVRGV